MWLKFDFLNGRFNLEEEYNNYLQILLVRVDNNDFLMIDEWNEFCYCFDKVERDKYKICEDIVFRDLYLDYFIFRFEG